MEAKVSQLNGGALVSHSSWLSWIAIANSLWYILILNLNKVFSCLGSNGESTTDSGALSCALEVKSDVVFKIRRGKARYYSKKIRVVAIGEHVIVWCVWFCFQSTSRSSKPSLPLAELKFVNNVKAEPFYPSGHTTLCCGQKEFHGPEDSLRKISDVQWMSEKFLVFGKEFTQAVKDTMYKGKDEKADSHYQEYKNPNK